MSLPHALLTSLVERPSSGLELASRFDKSIGYFWQATHQQIYRELARLEEAGWVSSEAVEQSRGRKRLYKVLPAGRRELKRWITDEGAMRPLRNELLIRLRAEAAVGPTGLADEIERRLQVHRDSLAHYEAIEARDFTNVEGNRERQLQHLVLQAGKMQEALWIELHERALVILRSEDAAPARRATRR